jgi:hypothetical protein
MGGLFESYKELPLLSMAATVEGTRLAEDILRELGFARVMQWSPNINHIQGLKIEAMPNYVYEVVMYPRSYKHATKEVIGTCVSMGINVEGKDGRDTQKDIDNGDYDSVFEGY